MKKWILGVLVLTSMSFGLSAQQHKNFRQGNPTERAQKMTDRMAEELKLTDEQRKQVSQLTRSEIGVDPDGRAKTDLGTTKGSHAK